MVQRLVSGPHQPNLGAGMLFPQPIRLSNGIFAQGIAAAANVYRDNLAMMARLYKMTDVPY